MFRMSPRHGPLTAHRRPSAAMIVSLIALFVALGGSAYAALRLPAGSVGSKQLKNGAVSEAKLKNGAVTARKLRNNSVTAATVKDHSLLAKDFKPGQLPKGDRGLQGPPGPSDALVFVSGTGQVTVGVGAGSYIVTGEARYVSSSASDYSAQCTLGSPTGRIAYHVDTSTLPAGDSLAIPIHGSAEFAASGNLTVNCRTAAGIVAYPWVTLIKVGTLSGPGA